MRKKKKDMWLRTFIKQLVSIEKKIRIFQHKLKPKSATKATIRRNNNG
jgi:hypothetical protein